MTTISETVKGTRLLRFFI